MPPKKVDNPHRTRIATGGDQLDCNRETSTNSAAMLTIDIHQNTVLSTPGARCTVADAGNVPFCSTSQEAAQCVRFRLRQIPKSVQEKSESHRFFVDSAGHMHANIKGTWHRLKKVAELPMKTRWTNWQPMDIMNRHSQLVCSHMGHKTSPSLQIRLPKGSSEAPLSSHRNHTEPSVRISASLLSALTSRINTGARLL